jgi:hypothetical protein
MNFKLNFNFCPFYYRRTLVFCLNSFEYNIKLFFLKVTRLIEYIQTQLFNMRSSDDDYIYYPYIFMYTTKYKKQIYILVYYALRLLEQGGVWVLERFYLLFSFLF